MKTEVVILERREGYSIITLNRPEKLNSLTESVFASLKSAFTDADQDKSCRALVLTGAGRGFCGGQDLAALMQRPGDVPDPAPIIERCYNPLLKQMRSLPIPIICAVNGVAAGAGANIAFACDLVLAARSAKFVQPFVKLGLVPDSGGTWFLPQLIGGQRARGLALLGESIDAEQAENWGLIWKCVDDASLMDEACDIALRFASQSSTALSLTKRALNEAEENTLDRQLDVERDLQGLAGRSPDYAEGVTAFLEKRKPKFGARH